MSKCNKLASMSQFSFLVCSQCFSIRLSTVPLCQSSHAHLISHSAHLCAQLLQISNRPLFRPLLFTFSCSLWKNCILFKCVCLLWKINTKKPCCFLGFTPAFCPRLKVLPWLSVFLSPPWLFVVMQQYCSVSCFVVCGTRPGQAQSGTLPKSTEIPTLHLLLKCVSVISGIKSHYQ